MRQNNERKRKRNFNFSLGWSQKKEAFSGLLLSVSLARWALALMKRIFFHNGPRGARKMSTFTVAFDRRSLPKRRGLSDLERQVICINMLLRRVLDRQQ
jgi:hypothetical protein